MVLFEIERSIDFFSESKFCTAFVFVFIQVNVDVAMDVAST